MKVNLRELYKREIVNLLRKKFVYEKNEEVPKLVKISVNQGLGEASKNSKELSSSVREFALITGQKPRVNKALKSVSGFKIRDGMPVGVSVTLRNYSMYNFFAKLIHIILPRVRDFRGLKTSSFDGRGNYNFGLSEQSVFPELFYDDIGKIRGFDVSIVTTAKTDEEGFFLLKEFGMPFQNKVYDKKI